jgi:hypothetical protein
LRRENRHFHLGLLVPAIARLRETWGRAFQGDPLPDLLTRTFTGFNRQQFRGHPAAR